MRRNNVKQVKNEPQKPVITQKFTVRNSEELLSFLLSKCNTSRNNVKSLLTNRQILVNGNLVTQYNYLVAREDIIEISKYPVNQKTPPKLKKNQVLKKPRIEIIYEDEYFIAINKPAGLLSVESDNDNNSAYLLVSDYLKEFSKTLRPFIIHRIDKETSGVLVFAKNEIIHSMLRLNWNKYVVEREYIAVVAGKTPNKEDTLKNYLKENQNNLVYVAQTGDLAITHYKVLKTNNKYSMLKVLIDTGRKNQIRVQMKNIGNPVVGDTKYEVQENPLKRLGLHASVLKLTNPLTKEVITFSAKAPNIFNGLFVRRED